MIFRNLDVNGDWQFGNGKGSYVSGDQAIALNIRTRILSWLNDCYFDQIAGIDWANRLGSKNQRALLEQDIRRIILQSFGVTGIINFDTILDSGTRMFTARYNIYTIFSPSFQNAVSIGF